MIFFCNSPSASEIANEIENIRIGKEIADSKEKLKKWQKEQDKIAEKTGDELFMKRLLDGEDFYENKPVQIIEYDEEGRAYEVNYDIKTRVPKYDLISFKVDCNGEVPEGAFDNI